MLDIDKANALDWLNEIATNPKGWRMFYSDSETKCCVETAIAMLKEQDENIQALRETVRNLILQIQDIAKHKDAKIESLEQTIEDICCGGS